MTLSAILLYFETAPYQALLDFTFSFLLSIHTIVLYSHNPCTNLRTSMNERNTLLYKNISLTHYSRKGWFFVGWVWEMGGETYTKRKDFFQEPGGCQRLPPLASSSETPLIGCISLARLRFSASVKIWPRGSHPVIPFQLPVRPESSDAPSSPCLPIKMWQLTKAYGVTRKETKMHVISYITIAIIFRLVFQSLWMRLSKYRISPILLVLLRHPFCSPGEVCC